MLRITLSRIAALSSKVLTEAATFLTWIYISLAFYGVLLLLHFPETFFSFLQLV